MPLPSPPQTDDDTTTPAPAQTAPAPQAASPSGVPEVLPAFTPPPINSPIRRGIGQVLGNMSQLGGVHVNFEDTVAGKELNRHYAEQTAIAKAYHDAAMAKIHALSIVDPTTGNHHDADTGQDMTPEKRQELTTQFEHYWGNYSDMLGNNKVTKQRLLQQKMVIDHMIQHGGTATKSLLTQAGVMPPAGDSSPDDFGSGDDATSTNSAAPSASPAPQRGGLAAVAPLPNVDMPTAAATPAPENSDNGATAPSAAVPARIPPPPSIPFDPAQTEAHVARVEAAQGEEAKAYATESGKIAAFSDLYQKLQKEHPDWDEDQLIQAASIQSGRPLPPGYLSMISLSPMQFTDPDNPAQKITVWHDKRGNLFNADKTPMGADQAMKIRTLPPTMGVSTVLGGEGDMAPYGIKREGHNILPGDKNWSADDQKLFDAKMAVFKKQQLAKGLAESSLTPEALDLAANQYIQTGDMPGLGFSPVLRRQVLNRAGELAKGGSVGTNEALYRADRTAISRLQTTRQAVGAFELTAEKNLQMFEDQAQKVIDSGSPWINQPLRTVETKGLGSADLTAYNTARQVALTEIARVLSNPNLTGVLSDEARSEVGGLIGPDATLEQVHAASTILRKDMANRTGGLDQQISDLTTHLKSIGPGPASNANDLGPAPAGAKEGDTGTFNGKRAKVVGGRIIGQ